tara:strand:+ start:1212 stop:4931 length:3720 start_codon:yes stop_codon:yes gene_type:complete
MAHESDSSKQLTSLLINRQVPEFVREDHPIFISFLEAYYEFLETEQGTQNNDLVKVTKDMRRKSDVDDSIDAFENSFFNTFANLVPKDAKIDKAFLIKNVLPLYLSKGNEKSFKLLFRMIFGEESDIIFPEDQVLRASDGQYASESILTITDQISSFYTGTGNTNQSIQLVQEVSPEEIEVKVDGVKKDHVTDYFIRKEDKKIFFNDTVTVKRDLEGEIIVGTNTSFIDLDTANMSSLAVRTSNLQELLISGDIIPGRTTLTFKDKAPNFNIYTADIEVVSNSTNLQLSNITTTPFGNSAQTVVSNFPADSVNVSGSNTGFFTTTSNVGTPASGSDIRVLYNDFNDALLKNRKFRGVTSNATMIVERVFPRKIDVLPKIELFFDSRKSLGSFSQSEEVKSTIVVNGDVINISTNTFSSLEEISVIQGGNNYNVGDPVTIIAGGFKRKAAAEVATLGSAILEKPNVIQGGAGFAAGGLLKGGNSEVGIVLYTIAANVNTIPIIDTTGINTPNTFVLMGETYDATVTNNSSQTYADLIIANANGTYTGAFGNTQVTSPTVNTRIKHVVNSSVQAANIGPISQSQVIVVTSNTPIVNLPLDGAGALVEVAARTTADVGSLKSLGKLTLRTFRSNTNVETGIVTFDNVSVGNTFSTNDIIEFSSTGAGDGALARVKEVNATGEIINTEFVHPHYKNFGTGIRSSVVNIAPVVANTGFNGTLGVPNVYVSSIVVDAVGITEANINVGLSGVYMTPQSNHAGFNFHKGDNPVRIGDIISILGHERKVTNVSSNITIPLQGMFHECGFLTVDRPFPREADFLYFSNTTYFGAHGLANSTVNISPSHTGTSLNVSTDTMNISNIFGAPMSIDTHFPKGGAAYDPSHLPNVSIFRTNRTNAAALRTISGITVNSSAVGVNSFISLFTESQTYADQSEMKLVANARIFVSSNNQVENVTVIRGGALTGDTISVANIYTDVVFAENNAPLTSKAYSNAVFTVKTVSADNFALSGNILSTAANANIAVNCLLGDGEEIISETDESLEGSIKTIRVTDAGLGYQAIPDIDLTDSGDGNATAVAGLTDSVSTTDGRFISSRGLISARERKVQGENYYQEFVYVTKVPVEFEKYKTILKGLLHPAGYRNRAEFEAKEISNANVFVSTTSVSNSIPGTVNISNGSTVVTGLNTSFEIANSQNTIVLGVSKIAIGNVKAGVHSNSRLIVSITNNTSLVVNTAFEKTLTGQSAIILV